MAKFVNSKESISSSFLLWNQRPTQVSIEETYDMKVWPITNILNDGPINFNIPPQPKGMLSDIHICTKIKLQKDGVDITRRENLVSITNNFANSLWGQLDIQVDDRIDITQSMKNAYAYQTFFNHVLNTESTHSDYLYYNELFKMDEGVTKDLEESERNFWIWNKDINLLEDIVDEEKTDGEKKIVVDNIKEIVYNYDRSDILKTIREIHTALGNTSHLNIGLIKKYHKIIQTGYIPYAQNVAATDRVRNINKGESVTLNSKLQCPLFNTSKCLPTDMKIRLSLTKNSDDFYLLCTGNYSVYIEDCYLIVTYYRPRDSILQLIEQRIQKEPACYGISRPELIVKPISNAGRIIRLTDIFHDKIPPYAFFCLQKSSDFEGKSRSNPFIFVPFKKFQFYLNGTPYFKDPLEVSSVSQLQDDDYIYSGYGEFLRQLYETIGKDLKGNCLINSSNFHLNFMVGMSFGADRKSLADGHLNLQEQASTYLEIDMGINNVPSDMVLIVYAVFDRQILIDGNRKIQIIE